MSTPIYTERNYGIFNLPFEKATLEKASYHSGHLLENAIRELKSSKKPSVELTIAEAEGALGEYLPLEDKLIEILSYQRARIRVAAGPILEGDERNYSPFLSLAHSFPGRLSLFIRPHYNSDLWKILAVDGEHRIMQIKVRNRFEEDSFFLSNLYQNMDCQENNNPTNKSIPYINRIAFPILTKQKIDAFENMLAREIRKYGPGCTRVITLTKKQLLKARTIIEEKDGFFDEAHAEEIIKAAISKWSVFR